MKVFPHLFGVASLIASHGAWVNGDVGASSALMVLGIVLIIKYDSMD